MPMGFNETVMDTQDFGIKPAAQHARKLFDGDRPPRRCLLVPAKEAAEGMDKATLAKQRESLRRESEVVAGKRDALDQRERDLDARFEAQRKVSAAGR